MPSVQYDYDGYDYIVKKRSTANRASSTSAPTKASSKGYAPSADSRRNSTQARTTSANRSTTSRTTRSAATATRTVASTSRATSSRTATTRATTKTTTAKSRTNKAASIEATRSANRASVRAIMADNGTTSTKKKATTQRRKTTNKNLEVPSMLKSKAAKPKEMSLKHAEKVIAPKTKAKTKTVAKKKESILKTIAYSMCAFSMLFLICYRSSAINEAFNSLGSIKSELTDVNTMNAQLQSDIETQTDLSNIEMYAKYQLGMQKPTDSQIRRIAITKEDKISTPVVIESEDTSFWSKLWHDFVNILD